MNQLVTSMNNNNNNCGVVVKVQNLPWATGEQDIRTFFVRLSVTDIRVVGGVDGEAFVTFSTDEDARKAMTLNGGYVRGVKVETSLSSAAERRTAVDDAAGREMRLPFDVPNRDPRLRNMLYRLQRRTDGIGNCRTAAALQQSAGAGCALRAGDNSVPAALLQFCGDAILNNGSRRLPCRGHSRRSTCVLPAVAVVVSTRGHRRNPPANRSRTSSS